jgi:hypothetical protein
MIRIKCVFGGRLQRSLGHGQYSSRLPPETRLIRITNNLTQWGGCLSDANQPTQSQQAKVTHEAAEPSVVIHDP